MLKERIFWITRTAVFLAILIAVQAVLNALGQYVVGSLVNMILILSVMIGGLWSGMAVALLSPILAFLLGIGMALPQVMPVMMLGNLSIILLWHFIAGKAPGKQYPRCILALIAAAATKFLILWFGIVKVVLPLLQNLPGQQTTMLSAAFSFPQLITAAVGGTIAVLMLPLLSRLKEKENV